jgi:hypothetical protein
MLSTQAPQMTRYLPVMRGVAQRIQPAVARWPLGDVAALAGRRTRRR